jgi:hypothetical protein
VPVLKLRLAEFSAPKAFGANFDKSRNFKINPIAGTGGSLWLTRTKRLKVNS